MRVNTLVLAGVAVAAALSWSLQTAAQSAPGSGKIKHVLLLSIDGMHAVDFYNCSRGIAGANDGDSHCPNMAALSRTGITYVGAVSSKTSDSFPGIAALVTGGTPKSTALLRRSV
jgi:predicted AlkP superfamily pyrophosphatase or phosphodiesterase